MRWPENCQICEQPEQKSFAALMELYEQNYIRLRCLCPSLKKMQGEFVSQVGNGKDLHLSIIEQVKHTTTLRLTYLMEDEIAPRPDLMVRLYYDARQAEVLRHQCKLTWPELTQNNGQAVEPTLSCRWRANRLLYKWLNYCRSQGYAFASTLSR